MTSMDRTPKPCHHKQVTHQHGTRVCYVADRCRCPACTEANRIEQRRRARLQMYGRYDRFVDPAPAREHVDRLRALGMGTRQIAAAAGIDRKLVQALPHRQRISRTTQDRILAVTVAELGAHAIASPAESEQARRQLQALVAYGWPVAQLERRRGFSAGNLGTVLTGDRPLLAGTVRAAAAAYAELSTRRPPEQTPAEKTAATRARNYARGRGWLLPIELELTDEPDDHGLVVDQIAIERRMAGDKAVRLTAAERAVLVDRWIESGRPLVECERVAGLNPRRYLTKGAAA